MPKEILPAMLADGWVLSAATFSLSLLPLCNWCRDSKGTYFWTEFTQPFLFYTPVKTQCLF